MNQRLIVFWKHEDFPFISYHEAFGYSENGRVYIADGYTVKPLFCLPRDKGEELIAKLQEITTKRKEALKVLEASAKEEVDNLIKEYIA